MKIQRHAVTTILISYIALFLGRQEMLRESMTTIEDSNEGSPRDSTNQLGSVNTDLLFHNYCMNMTFD